jgi:hypothetical protein
MLTSSKFRRLYDAVTVDVHTGGEKNYELKHSTIGWGQGRSKKGSDAILHGFVHGHGYSTNNTTSQKVKFPVTRLFKNSIGHIESSNNSMDVKLIYI